MIYMVKYFHESKRPFELYLANDYENNIKIFQNMLGTELQTETGTFSEGWWLWPIGRSVEKHGIENIKVIV